MERLTEMYGGMMVPRKACTFDREGGADDCKECTEICEDEGGVCRTCILQECLTRLGEYEDTGLTPEQIRELKDRDTAKAPEVGGVTMPKILDACCGSRMFWFDRNNPDVIFADNRKLETTLCDGRTLVIEPDIVIDFRNMPFDDNTFDLVVFDPPHLIRAGEKSWLAKKYGVLPEEWEPYLKAGFDECMRVLKPDHSLIMKWNEEQIRTADMLKAIKHEPLFGDRRSKTRWLCFMKGVG